MNANLLSQSLDALGSDFPRLCGLLVGEPVNATRSALDLLLPVVIGSLALKGRTLEGVADLTSLVGATKLDVGLLENVKWLFGRPVSSVNDLLKVGTSRLVPGLFGNSSAALVNAISTTSGIRRSSATTLVAMIVPIVLTVVKKQIADKGLVANSLSSLLKSQRANVRYKLDSRIIGALGFAGRAEFLDELSSQSNAGVASADADLRSHASGTVLVEHDVVAMVSKFRLARWLPWLSSGLERRA